MENVYFMTIFNILRPVGIVCVHFGIFFPVLVCLDQEKSGKPARDQASKNDTEKVLRRKLGEPRRERESERERERERGKERERERVRQV
jgi:hypothetical protein